jgi:uncharacterized membrane protein
MWQSEVSVEIDAPVAEVYSYLADFPRHPEWSSAALTDLRMLTPGPISVGSEFETVDHVPNKQVTRSRVTALEPSRRIAWRSLGVRGLLPVDWEFLLSEQDGTTHLVQQSRWRPGLGPVGALLMLIRGRQIPIENRRSLVRIKAALENKVSVSGSRTS